MLITLLEAVSISLYLGILFFAWRALNQDKIIPPAILAILSVAIICHGYLAYLLIDGGEGQNLSVFNIFNMTTWIAMVMVFWNLLRHKATSLLILSLPVAALSILEAALFANSSAVVVHAKPLNLLHIFSGIAAMSILLLSALQSLLVLYLDRGLKHHPANIHLWLGPLEKMERFLIQLLTTGFALMSVSLFLVLWLPGELKSAQALHKVILTSLSWIVLAILIYGRYIKGWRGVYAAQWSLVGVFLLLLGYFGSKLVLEYILN